MTSRPSQNAHLPAVETTGGDGAGILVVSPSWVGDFVRNHTLVQVLADRHPGRPIDLLTNPVCQPLGELMPLVRRTWALDAGRGQVQLGQRWRLARQMRWQRYGTAVVVMGSLKAALVPFLAGIPERIGWLGEHRYGLINRICRRADPQRTTIDGYALLGLTADEAKPARWPEPHLHVPAPKIEAWKDRNGVDGQGQPIIALCPGANSEARMWPTEHYAQLARHCRAAGWTVWVLGAAREQAMADEIDRVAGGGCVSFTGTDLHDCAIQLAAADVVVANDSGLLHLGAALGKPCIALFGPTPPHHTGPLNSNVTYLEIEIECRHCWGTVCPLGHHRCLRDIAPERVFEAVERTLG